MQAPETSSAIAYRRTEDRRPPPRLFGFGFLISAVLHVAALYFIRIQLPTRDDVVEAPPQLIQFAPRTRIYEFDLALEMPSAEPEVSIPVAPPEITPPRRVEPRPVAPPVAAPRSDAPAGAASGGGVPGEAAGGRGVPSGDPNPLDRLRYRNSTTDVWRRSEPTQNEIPLTDEEIARARLATRIAAYNDSMAAEAGAAARATDWTVKDAEGNRWGVSPGKIHLGGLTLPLPFTFAPPPGKREEVAGRVATWNAIQQQATSVEGREVVKDRIKAIEKRKAAERAARQGSGTSGGSTTGGGGGGGS